MFMEITSTKGSPFGFVADLMCMCVTDGKDENNPSLALLSLTCYSKKFALVIFLTQRYAIKVA